jgi:hypothetical protein
MTYPTLAQALVSGMIAMGYLVAGVFFLRFWRRTTDGLFLAFALAFWLMAANTILPILLGVPREEWTPFYLLRLAAFLLIAAAIVRKNLGGGRRSDGPPVP